MAIPVKHFITYGRNKVPRYAAGHGKEPGESPYAWIAWCSCQWQGLGIDEAHAKYLVHQHGTQQTMRGNIVVFEAPAPDAPKESQLEQFRSNKMDPGLPGHPAPSPQELEGFKP